MPSVKSTHEAAVHGRIQRAQAASSLPPMSAATANAKGTAKPT